MREALSATRLSPSNTHCVLAAGRAQTNMEGYCRSPAVNLPQLAMRVEAAHFPDPTASCDPPLPETTVPTGTYFLMIKIDSY